MNMVYLLDCAIMGILLITGVQFELFVLGCISVIGHPLTLASIRYTEMFFFSFFFLFS